jgi:predicted alpha-1,2-mannosidase
MRFFVILGSVVLMNSAAAQITQLRDASDKAQGLVDNSTSKRIAFDATRYVNPFIGTGGHGHTFPGAVVPFGMAQVSPDTRPYGWDGCSGYHYSDSVIYGFANTHLSGTGIPDYSDILVIPQMGKLNLVPGFKKKGGYGASFKHENETASPGFYAVKLDNGIEVKLTATERCGIHQYTFPKSKGKKYIIIDLGYRDKVIATDAKAIGKNQVTGKRISKDWAPEQHLYFDLRTNIDFRKASWKVNEKTGQYQMVLEFPETTEVVELRIGLSGSDIEGATKNLEAETSTYAQSAEAAFTVFQSLAVQKWATELRKVTVSGGSKDDLIKFYTALYHVFTHPSLWSDVDGRYRTYKNTIEVSETPVYSVFSLWDTYRAANPLYTILQPDRAKDFIESFRLQAEQTGILPVWTLSNNETNCMIGYHSVSIIADAYLKGIELNKPKELLEAMVRSAKEDRVGKIQYAREGFISADGEAESVSKTLEYSYDDWCIAEFAKALGNEEIEKEFRMRSASYLNLWNQESGFFQPRVSGVWMPNYRPNEVNHHYTEANGWQYSLAPQHNIMQMNLLHGGPKGLERFLDRMFNDASGMSGREQADITGLIGQYAHGNEPSHHMAYAYNFAGVPSKTQDLVRRILEEQYRNAPDGLSGNEDCGQMSAWFVMSSLGFYAYAPGSPTYTIGTPLFQNVTLYSNGNPTYINSMGTSKEKHYVQSVSVDGKKLDHFYLDHSVFKKGSNITFEMGEEPNNELGKLPLDITAMVPKDFVAVPYFNTTQQVFDNELEIKIEKLSMEEGGIYFALNGGEFEPYTKPIRLTSTTTIEAKIVRHPQAGGAESKVVENTFRKFTSIGRVTSISTYENHYSAGGDQNILDGRVGKNEYRGTEWQGFNDKDVDITIELKEQQQLTGLMIGAMQDTRSWIFVPKEIIVEGSLDGKTFFKMGKVASKIDAKTYEGRAQLLVEFAPTNVKP